MKEYIKKLLLIDFSKFSKDFIVNNLPLLYSTLTIEKLDELLKQQNEIKSGK